MDSEGLTISGATRENLTCSPSPCTLTPLDLEEGQQFEAGSSVYSMVKYIGEGVFGKVALWKDLRTNETVVVKILKKTSSPYLEKEVAILKAVNALGPEKINVVGFHDRIDAVGHDGLVFEQLHIHLYELLRRRDRRPLSPSEIRPIAVQMLVALDALKSLGVLHTDIKPDNIMLVGGEDQPFKVRLIDFGNAIYASEARPGPQIQALGYRAPEVFLGLKYNEAVDMWGLACVLVYLYLADHLFPYGSPYKTMRSMVKTLGLPEDHQLRAGMYTRMYFTKQGKDPQEWRFLIPVEYAVITNLPAEEEELYYQLPGGLDDLIDIHPDQDDSDLEERRMFADLLKGMLRMDGARRLTPRQALQHPFFGTSDLGERFDSGVDLTSSQDFSPSGTQTLNSQPSACSWESHGAPETQQGAYRFEIDEDSLITPDWSASQERSPAPAQTTDSLLSCIKVLFSSEEVQGPSEGEDTMVEADTLSCPNTQGSVSVSDSNCPHTNDCQTEDDAASSTPEPEGPPAGPPGRLRKTLKRVRRVFKRVKNFCCCCLRPETDD